MANRRTDLVDIFNRDGNVTLDLKRIIKHTEKQRLNKSTKVELSHKVKTPFATPVKNRMELQDYDYTDKLSTKDLSWLKSFNEEYVNCNFKHSGKKLIKGKKNRKRAYDANNSRNRDIFNKLKISGKLVYKHLKTE